MTANSMSRSLCGTCGCVFVTYDPPDALASFFAREYDLSDAVQNNLVVENGQVVPKRSLVQGRLFDFLDKQPRGAKGRLLEIASGTGQLTRELAQKLGAGWGAVGVDPSGDAPIGTTADGQIEFIRDFFHGDTFEASQFDLIVAHGFLNRSEPLKQLRAMARLARPGALLSLELVFLEETPFTPHIWDHPYNYTRRTLEAWLEGVGVRVIDIRPCGSAHHILGEFVGPIRGVTIPSDGLSETESHYQRWLAWWDDVYARYSDFADNTDGPFLLFGAGVFTGVLAARFGTTRWSGIVDEVKAGSVFHGVPVMSLSEASGTRLPIAVCTRPSYVEPIVSKLRKAKIEHQLIQPSAD